MWASRQTATQDCPQGYPAALNWTSDDESSRCVAHHQAGRALVCFVLYGAEVVREVSLDGSAGGAARMSTYSRLPIPLSCRPVPGAPRRGNPAPVSGEAILDAHGILTYSGLVAECLFDNQGHGQQPSEVTFLKGRGDRFRKDLEGHAALGRMLGVAMPGAVAPEGWVQAYWEEALRLVSTSWAGVEWVASELMARKSLSGDKLDSMLAGLD